MTKMITKNVSIFTKSPKLIAFNWNDRDDGSDVVSAVDGGAVHVVAGVCGGVGVFGLLFFLLLLLLGWGCSC